MLWSSSRPNGFTLAELSVILAVMGILSAIAIPSFLSWYQSKQLNDALSRLENALREAQQQAITRSQTCTVNIPTGTDRTISGNCLITGDRPLKHVQIWHSRTLNNNQPWRIQFDFKGRTEGFDQNGTIFLAIPETTTATRCLVISNGIGLMRTGNYDLQKQSCTTPQ
ncbi:MAG: GspH/FimT family pseudopilin [Thermosynechococcaceae cyanobacterium]